MIRVLVSAWAFLASSLAFASTMPLNNLHLQDNPKVLYNVGPQDFKRIIDQVVQTFGGVVRAHGGELKVNYLWNDGTVNAFAQREGNVWMISMFGGLARRREITKDGFAMVVCHELGHHIAGYPFKSGRWASTEGESDYFAAQVCARAIWFRDQAENAKHRATVDPMAKTACDRMWRYEQQRDLCYRIADAGESLATLLNALHVPNRPISYRSFSRERVALTEEGHPAAQCRLETYINGALCRRSFNVSVIPGEKAGSPMDQEKEAARYSCEEMGSLFDGSRPACWFRPLLERWN